MLNENYYRHKYRIYYSIETMYIWSDRKWYFLILDYKISSKVRLISNISVSRRWVCLSFHHKAVGYTYYIQWHHVICTTIVCFLYNTVCVYKKISFCNDSYPNVNGKDKSVSINFILLLAKKFIFKCKNRKETPCMFQFEISISERRGLEEIIAFNRNKTDQLIEKWQHLY